MVGYSAATCGTAAVTTVRQCTMSMALSHSRRHLSPTRTNSPQLHRWGLFVHLTPNLFFLSCNNGIIIHNCRFCALWLRSFPSSVKPCPPSVFFLAYPVITVDRPHIPENLRSKRHVSLIMVIWRLKARCAILSTRIIPHWSVSVAQRGCFGAFIAIIKRIYYYYLTNITAGI